MINKERLQQLIEQKAENRKAIPEYEDIDILYEFTDKDGEYSEYN